MKTAHPVVPSLAISHSMFDVQRSMFPHFDSTLFGELPSRTNVNITKRTHLKIKICL
jgi:hypothetical protein